MFAVGDMVCYGAQGVCRVEELATRNFGDADKLYYMLKSVNAAEATVFVPADNEKLTGRMRRVLSPSEIGEMIRAVSAEEPVWELDENRRKEQYRELLTGGDRKALARQVRALYHHRQEQRSRDRKLHVCDERFLKDAERILCDEFALVLCIKPEQVLPFIMEQLPEEERQALAM